MTIRVTIANEEPSGSRTLLVTTVCFNKGRAGARDIQHQQLAPGQKAEFYVHALKDLRVEELLGE